ncbi:MAG TPA: porin family protein [Candidatus Bathyarchaeia archaeon]|nr:porin family protein [Candidatus Bathyarchaeia archaeon]
MKRSAIVLMIALAVGLPALPRAARAQDVQFGLKAGGNMARPTGIDARDPMTALKTKTGFTGGLFLVLNFGQVVSVQWEALYTMKGAAYAALDGSFTDKLYADYIEVPLLLKLRLPTAVVQPFVFAGPTVGFKLKEKFQANGEDVPLGRAVLKNNDYGVLFGAGLNLGREFMVDLRYSLGMQKVIAIAQGEVQPDYRNGVLSATLGIVF